MNAAVQNIDGNQSIDITSQFSRADEAKEQHIYKRKLISNMT